MLFVGVDLAWSEKNNSGIALLKSRKGQIKYLHSRLVLTDDEILQYIAEKTKETPSLIAIDAPLVVPNEYGQRPADRLITKHFGKYEAGAYPANRQILSKYGSIRGEEITKLLQASCFTHDPEIKRFEKSRKFLEVYPHPAMVVLFNLKKTLKYKKRRNRPCEVRLKELKRYQNYLRKLITIPRNIQKTDDILSTDVTDMKVKSLKDLEDRIDAIMCAYIAYYCWSNPNKCKIFGTREDGYILTPISGQTDNRQSFL